MENHYLPTTLPFLIQINDRALMLMQQVREHTVRTVVPIRSFGQKLPVILKPTAERYEVELEQSRLVAPGQEAISDWHTLHDFTLAIRCGKLLTIYRNCEFTELTTRHENGKQLLTHAKLQARHRSCVETAS